MANQESRKTRRAGGRKARVALRAAPLADDVRPVRGGLEGGWYKPLSAVDQTAIHNSALRILREIGIADAPESGIAAMTRAGVELGEDGRLRFPSALVEAMVAKAGRNFTLCGQDPKHDLKPGGTRVYFGTGGAAVHLVDIASNDYRESNLQDLYDAARIVDGLDNIHYFQRPLVARDMVDARELDLNTLYASLSGTTKHVGTSFFSAENAREGLEMLYCVAGSRDAFIARPFASMSATFVVPPLRFATEACETLEAGIAGGMPVLLLSAGQAGATSPAAIAGSVTQAIAECLAGIVYVNSIAPGHPAMFGPWPFVSDLRTGSMSGGSGEQALLSAACGQMARFYDLPGAIAAGMADAKTPDAQSGYEKGITNVMAGLAGGNLIYECAGMHGSLMGFCHESAIIDNDMLGQCLRTVRGIEVTEENMSFDVIAQVCLEGPRHFLGHDQTLSLMQTEYVYPEIGDRSSPKEWIEQGRPNLLEKAMAEKNRILEGVFPDHIPEELDRELRQKFDIKLPRANMLLPP